MIPTNKSKKNKDWMQYISLSTQWIVLLGLAVWIGIFLDRKISETSKICTISLPLLALGLSLWQLIRKLNQPK
jgi:F0F1-type ATP synthase assembly protein I